VSGFTGVPARDFAVGMAMGACVTMALQLAAGYVLRSNANPYLAGLAMVALPNLVGQVLGPLAVAAGFLFAGKGRPGEAKGVGEGAAGRRVDGGNGTGAASATA
jgi:hypothetical protein